MTMLVIVMEVNVMSEYVNKTLDNIHQLLSTILDAAKNHDADGVLAVIPDAKIALAELVAICEITELRVEQIATAQVRNGYHRTVARRNIKGKPYPLVLINDALGIRTTPGMTARDITEQFGISQPILSKLKIEQPLTYKDWRIERSDKAANDLRAKYPKVDI